MAASKGKPNCHLCHGTGETRGRGTTHICFCITWQLRELREEVDKAKTKCREALAADKDDQRGLLELIDDLILELNCEYDRAGPL